MRAARPRRAVLVAAVLAAVALVAGCDQGASPLDSRATASPEPTLDTSALVLPSGVVPTLSDVQAPSSADPTGGIPVSDEGVGVAGEGDVVVDVYFDFMCPYCGLLDQINGPDLDALVAEGGVTVVYHPVTILDRYSQGTAYSTRAVNAVAVVADREPEHVPAFIAALLADGTQPEENTEALTDAQIAQTAQDVGVSEAVTDTFTATAEFQGTQLRTFVPWAAAVTALLPVNPATGYQSTPTLLVDGEWFAENWMQSGTLRAAVEAAKA